MRKNRILTLQKLAEQRKAATLELTQGPQDHGDQNMKHALRGKVSLISDLLKYTK